MLFDFTQPLQIKSKRFARLKKNVSATLIFGQMTFQIRKSFFFPVRAFFEGDLHSFCFAFYFFSFFTVDTTAFIQALFDPNYES